MEEKKKVVSGGESDQVKKVDDVEHGSKPQESDRSTQSDGEISEKLDDPKELQKEEQDSQVESKIQNESMDEDKPIVPSSESTEEKLDLTTSDPDHSDVEEPKTSFYWGASSERSETLEESDKPMVSSEKSSEEQTPSSIETSSNEVSQQETVNESKEDTTASSNDERYFNTMEFKAFDQWKTDETDSSSPKEVPTSGVVTDAKEEETSFSEDKRFNTIEFKTFDQWKTDEVDEPSTKSSNSHQLETSATPHKQTEGPKQVHPSKPSQDAKRKKLIGGIVAASLLVVGSVVAYTFNPFSDGSQAVAEVPQKQPANFQLMLDGQKYELDLYQVGYNGQDLATVDELKLRTWLDDVKKKVDQPAEDAKLKWFGREITPEKSGRRMDVKAVEAWLTDLKPLLNKPQQIPMVPEEPLITAEDLRQVDQSLIGKYRTTFDGSNTNRTTNIRLSSKAIDNMILMPGEEFSFNRVVGERTTSRGYKSAGVIVKGEFSEGVGGGICQVSSTLYNSVDKAGLKMTRVQHHSAEVTYVPPGRDATVSWGGPDFRFKNNLNKPILIKIDVGSNAMTVSTYTVPGAKKHKIKKDDQLESFVTKEETNEKDKETSTGKKNK